MARDDRRREIVVAFRGSHELADMVTGTFWGFVFETAAPLPPPILSPSLLTCIYACVLDGNLVLVPLVSRGIENNNSALVHAGFLISYNSVRVVVVHVVREQLLAFPNYTVVITGSYPRFCSFSCALVNG